ncbi:hypothetical protein COY00_03455 [Candidatus Pacearchaeota archaeon CG_4_10_14_0_2_um_filter_35_33]|nr:hypothetical protein [Candidatus Pacearchaeota archaeon]OIO43057.1 MAG: hypothetical protein AUJ63_01380 [Candidatus Pacearchaeota archaeon CG1_02_35_32]PIY81115.1 MAG: hypothetical protein COY79_04920 [Candidatus Pacearchaeota archaeon CG_4_10_14_0_8_um_filter_35_169]PIZ79764.1 MAG: hypothetical protein COY00_03455 [Candidatus Pacearchaeota archaeon CG_4_10_14_0_2_um_filter_35_33]PJB93923.1 MAG: hypothetical protein CO081_03625 [Candidatus Pacearchaeota archaeon CG_4_9_14_0_8_um_filter_35_2
MRFPRFFVIILILIFAARTVDAATIAEGIYGADLQLVEDSLVKLLNDDGSVIESKLSEDGLYYFETEPGTYFIRAEIWR